MSRCFPYPPPGYTLTSDKKEAWVERIKLEKERLRKKEKKERRKEKKEKKEKRKLRKEKRREETNLNSDKSNIQKHHISDKFDIPRLHTSDKSDVPKHLITQNGPIDRKVELLHKKRKAETEQLEQSSLTQEHACPVSLLVPSSSSESTEKSKKRKINSSPGDDTRVHGEVILMGLASMKQNEFHNLAKEQHCLASKRLHPLDGNRGADCAGDGPKKFLNGTAQNRFNTVYNFSKGQTSVATAPVKFLNGIAQNRFDIAYNINPGTTSVATARNSGQICSTPGQIETGKTPIDNTPKLPCKKRKAVLTPMQKEEMQYINLLDNFLPPPIQVGCVSQVEDLDWLLGSRNQETQAGKIAMFGNESSFLSRSSVLHPRAVYLPEADVYAMPYTVPY